MSKLRTQITSLLGVYNTDLDEFFLLFFFYWITTYILLDTQPPVASGQLLMANVFVLPLTCNFDATFYTLNL